MDLKAPFRAIFKKPEWQPTVPTDPGDLARFLAMVRSMPIRRPLIRIGGGGDGGYLVPDVLDGIAACFSPGVAATATFEEDLAARGIKCFLADYSVRRPPVKNPLFEFERKYLANRNDRKNMRLEDWVGAKRPGLGNGDLLLQMDIEGGEFDVFEDTPDDCLRQFRIIVTEFHFMDRLFDADEFGRIEPVFRKLANAFQVVHIHPNNNCRVVSANGFEIPELLEITFLRKDHFESGETSIAYPHPLDAPNLSNKPNIVLPDCWWR